MSCQHCCPHEKLEIKNGLPHCADCHKTWGESYAVGIGRQYVPIPTPYPLSPYWFSTIGSQTQESPSVRMVC